MNTYQLLRIGEHHVNHCEDYVLTAPLSTHRLVGAVMDGCTMGTDSYFAATLVGKLLRKIVLERSYQALYAPLVSGSVEVDLREILRQLLAEFRALTNQLVLRDDELLTTLLLMVLDEQQEEDIVLTVGDGLVCIDGQLTEYDHQNRPDYLGYHLGTDFNTWYRQQTQVISFRHFSDVSLSTDGIFTFAPYTKAASNPQVDPVAYLLSNRDDMHLPSMFTKKWAYLEQQCGLRPTDDLGIVRVVR
ncbi:Protein phosphatase 2C [Catalinimonas alkaloidigena]|uniref:Protein phosphatase 2C n=1 Tax=Catalinimonas alkaloidigena TaxID=1075417 RepID=A0A1G9GR68_9BACT|nr:protein phosphatase 2C domain-containing protein [Catalinimonas alkaloidigena]SDL03148.1 Protein phosphatase 2C [Catalinimonas alkaloidigena]